MVWGFWLEHFRVTLFLCFLVLNNCFKRGFCLGQIQVVGGAPSARTSLGL